MTLSPGDLPITLVIYVNYDVVSQLFDVVEVASGDELNADL